MDHLRFRAVRDMPIASTSAEVAAKLAVMNTSDWRATPEEDPENGFGKLRLTFHGRTLHCSCLRHVGASRSAASC